MTSRALMLPRPIRQAIVRHARRERPRECCGLLVGHGRTVVFAVEVANVAPGRTRYRLDPRAHIDVLRLLRRVAPRLAIVGVYHSHPAGQPMPSPTDIAMAMYPAWAYVIVGLMGKPRMAAFQIQRGRATRIALR